MKFFEKFVLKGIIKNIANKLPKIKDKVLNTLKTDSESLLAVVKDAIKEKLKNIFQ